LELNNSNKEREHACTHLNYGWTPACIAAGSLNPAGIKKKSIFGIYNGNAAS
jgi:hypothetical protein